jgi:hypothetical protein
MYRPSTVAICLVALLAGCSRPAPITDSLKNVPTGQADDSLQPALQVLRQASEARHFRDALNLVNAHRVKQEGKLDVHLTDSARTFLKDVVKLDAAELAEVDAGSFRPLDAMHLDSCFLFRDAARAIEVADLSPLEQALVAFGWTTRRVLLHEQRDEGLPPYLVVKRGFGGVRDRALVFLELLRQFQLEGCVVAFPGKPREPETLLVGVLIPSMQGHELALFDPRLGLPLPGGKGKPVATFAAVKAEPNLLAFANIPAAQLVQAEARPAYALTALAARMKFLEESLAGQDRVTFYQDAEALYEKLNATGLKIGAWPAEGPPPPRQLAPLFFPPSEGGRDQSKRLERFAIELVPVAAAVYRLQEMRVLFDLPDDAQVTLLTIIGDLFTKYYQQPHDMLLRGQYDPAQARIDRIGDVLEQDKFAQQIEETQFQQEVAKWRQQMKDAYLAAARQEPGADRRLKHLWAEDQYLMTLMDVEGSVAPQKFPRKMLTHIILRAVRERLGNMVDYLKAASWEEKAEKLEAQRRHFQAEGKRHGPVESAAHNAWKNTSGAWDMYIDRAALSPTQMGLRLQRLRGQRGDEPGAALGALEQLHLELHSILDARLQRAEALARLGQTKATLGLLEQIHADLLAQEKEGALSKEVEHWRAQAAGQTPLVNRLDLLSRDWTPQGHFYLMRLRVERMMQAWKTKG